MVNVEYMVAYSQVLEILKYIPKEDYNKIPQNMIKVFQNNCYQKSDFKYNPEKTLQEQNVTETARTIIALLVRDFWATAEQREKIINFQKQERLKQRNINDIFKKREIISQSIKQNKYNENLPAIIKKDNIFIKIKNFLKKIFGK